MSKRLPGEKMSDYLGRFSVELADAALKAHAEGDQVHALFFAAKAAETLALARTLGYDPALQSGEAER